jgi:hypothetical protein
MVAPIGPAPQQGKAIYVYLCDGQVIEVRPATSVMLTQDSVVVLNTGEAVSSFPRPQVYFVADEPTEPTLG